MNPIAEGILQYYGIGHDPTSIADDILMHIGVARRSGRYPWGSGENPYQRTGDFLARVEALKKNGWKETAENVKNEFGEGVTLNMYRQELALCKSQRRIQDYDKIKSLQADGLSISEIGRRMGKNESSIRGLLDEEANARARVSRNTADFIRKRVDESAHGMVDIGIGVDKELRVSKEKLNEALYLLEGEGYVVYSGGVQQLTTSGQQTTQRVICKPGTQHKEIYEFDKIEPLNKDQYVSRDGGETFSQFVYPKSMDSKRLKIRYADEVGPDGITGIEKDGTIEIRRGVKDLSLGDDHYSQVRILVDDTHYIKGMAVYSDDLPEGVDIVFNTNYTRDIPVMGPKNNTILKPIKEDPDNPFGSLIKADGQSTYIDDDGNEQMSLINKRASEGDWTEWKDALPSQFLGKQSLQMVKKQLNLAKVDKLAEYDEIMSLENPTIKKHYLSKFAEACDSAAVHLQAAALPGQKYHVILPINTLKDNEVYAPQYENGTKLALIRYPHGGTFEIPILTVNNRNVLARKWIGETSIDGIGINKTNADRLSGADFDGDTVMAIPTHDASGKVKITSTPTLKGLEGFEPKLSYPPREGMAVMSKGATPKQMGVISNLITDMTLKGANEDELTRAVRHSMVVIDAAKHKLDYKRSEYDNGIQGLVNRYQRKIDKDGNEKIGGASTILSRAKGQYSVEKRQGSPYINIKGDKNYDPSRPEGALIYKTADPDKLYKVTQSKNAKTGIVTLTTTSGEKIKYNPSNADERARYYPIKRKDPDTGEISFTNRDGTISYKYEARTQKSTNMEETDDAHTLVSEMRHPKEIAYADYANSMKALANQARKEMMSTGKIEYNKTANAQYKEEVESLNEKLRQALMNAPRERQALRLANYEVSQKLQKSKEKGETISTSDLKKSKQQAMTKARNEVNSIKRRDRNIDISDREWEAIQAGAIHESKLKQILNNADADKLRQRAMPRETNTISQAKINKIKAMNMSNYSLEEIARAVGCSPSTASKYLKGVT